MTIENQIKNENDQKMPHKFWWLWLPLIFFGGQIVLENTLDASILARILGENGPHEIMQALVITLALLVALCTLVKMNHKEQKGLTIWVGIAALSCFYVAGEEISWGQHILDWATPEFWLQVNDQQETNLHNTSSWFDQKPRLILELGVMVGGLLIPLLRRFKPAALPVRFNAIYPPNYLVVIAGIVAVMKVTDIITDEMGVIVFERVSEVIELYLFCFVLLYLLDLKGRILEK